MRLHPSTPPVPATCQHCGNAFTTWPSVLRIGRGRFCSPKCARTHSRTPAIDRFWKYVEKTETCWLWTGKTMKNKKWPYGLLYVDGRHVRAHRFSYEFHKGAIPQGLYVLHNCPGGDNPRCVNPDHLWAGTLAQNSQDAVRKGRLIPPVRFEPWKETHAFRQHPERIPRGQARGQAALSDEQATALRRRYAVRDISQRAVGALFGVSIGVAQRAIYRKSYRHVE